MKPTLSDHEKRFVRRAAVGVAIYLVLFFGARGWKYLDARRTAYLARVEEARGLRELVKTYQGRADVAGSLIEHFHMDPVKLDRTTLVADASAAIQKAATSGGMEAGPIRESPGRPSSKEIASIQFEGTGPVPAVLALLHNLEVIGFPVVIDSVQFAADPRRPNGLKVTMTIVVLDFEAWNKEEKPNA